MTKNKFIKIRATEAEQAHAAAVADAAGKSVAEVFREALAKLAKRHGVKVDAQ